MKLQNETALKTGQGSFFAMRVAPKIHHSMGGIGINVDEQALDVVSGEPIPSLFAAAEVTAGRRTLAHAPSRTALSSVAMPLQNRLG